MREQKKNLFELILNKYMEEEREEFLNELERFGLREDMSAFPDELVQSINKINLGIAPDFGKVMTHWVDKINERIRNSDNRKNKEKVKYLFSLFGSGLFEELKLQFPELENKMKVEMNAAAEDLSDRKNIDKEDLYEHLPIGKRLHERAAKRIISEVKIPIKSTNQDYFNILFSIQKLNELDRLIREQYEWTTRKGHFAKVLSKKSKDQTPIKIDKSKLPYLIHLFWTLWNKKLINPENGRFWETLQGKLTDLDGNYFDKEFKQLASRIRNEKGIRHSTVREYVDSVLLNVKL